MTQKKIATSGARSFAKAMTTKLQAGEGFGSPLLMTLTGDMDMSNASSTPDATTGSSSSSPLEKLTRAQVFARDPEAMTLAVLDRAIEELRAINMRNRKARADEAAVTEAAAKLKKTNAASRKKKPAASVAANILDTQL